MILHGPAEALVGLRRNVLDHHKALPFDVGLVFLQAGKDSLFERVRRPWIGVSGVDNFLEYIPWHRLHRILGSIVDGSGNFRPVQHFVRHGGRNRGEGEYVRTCTLGVARSFAGPLKGRR